MKTSHPLSQHRGNKMCFNKFWTQMSSKLPFPERPAISLDGLLLSLINLCGGGGGYTLWIPPQKRLLVMRGMFDSGPFSTIRRLFCVGCLALDRSLPSACFFLFLFLVFDFLVFWFCFVLRGILSSGPCAFLHSVSDCVSFTWFAFLSLFPLSPAKKLKNEDLSNSAPLSAQRLLHLFRAGRIHVA